MTAFGRRLRLASIGAVGLTLTSVVLVAPCRACDVCAVFTATDLQQRRVGPYLALAEQYSRFGSGLPQPDGSIRDFDERLNSSITQFVVGYTLDPMFSVQVNVPFIHRWFRRFENSIGGRPVAPGKRSDTETGFGDLSIAAILQPYTWVTETMLVRFSLLAGLKLPSGSTARLGEDAALQGAAEAVVADAAGDRAVLRDAHHIPAGSRTGINGHDLTLGSGSTDGILGGGFFGSWRRLFATTNFQYFLRSEGAYDYRFGNEIDWFTTLGYYAYLTHDRALALQFVLSGQYQEPDEIDGDEVGDELLWLFAGPGFTLTWGTAFAAEFAADLPIVRGDTGLVPIYRIRGGLSWRF